MPRGNSTNKTKTVAQKKHQENASKAMKMYKSGRVSSLKKAWSQIKKKN